MINDGELLVKPEINIVGHEMQFLKRTGNIRSALHVRIIPVQNACFKYADM